MNLLWTLAQGAPPAVAGGGPAGSDWDVLAAVLAAGPVVKGVMLLLLIFSVLSWAIIIAKFRQLRRAAQENALFVEKFAEARDFNALLEAARGFPASPAAAIFRRACEAPSAGWEGDVGGGQGPKVPGTSPTNPFRQDAARRAVRQALTGQVQLLSRQLSFLATCGNTAPFIGLFGTVWGIMSSFRQIGLTGSASLATVAPGIAEALIATAAGLAAAIPAVVAYNYFLGRLRRLEAELADFAGDLVSLLDRAGEPPPAA